MSIILFAVLIIILVALAMWLVNLLDMIPVLPRKGLHALILLAGIYAIGHQAALW